MIKKIEAFIKEYMPFNKEDKLVIALSSGVDSSVLYHVLKRLGYNLIIAHVNHNTRPETKVEQEYLINLAKTDNVPIEVYSFNHKEGTNFHDDAHHHRYEFFINVCKKYGAKYIVTAHHADDNLETIILNLMSGSNLYGYGGISPVLNIGEYKIVRPMLPVSKAEIINYAQASNIKWFEDSSNSENHYKRNRIRHNITPLIKAECPDILDKTASFSLQVKEAFAYIRKNAIEYLNKNNNIIKVDDFINLDVALKKDIICLLLETYDIEKNEEIISSILNMILSSHPQAELNLKNNYQIKKRYNKVYIEKNISQADYEYKLNFDDIIIINNKYKIYFSKNNSISNAFFISLCYNKMTFPLTIRNRCNEDVIEFKYGHKKIKDLFIDLKIPMETRNQIPLVFNNGELIWVINYAKSKFVVENKLDGDIYLICEVLESAK